MVSKKKVYLNSIAGRLARESKAGKNAALFFSPYLTSTTAESIITKFDAKTSEVYITFSLEVFISGGSSIDTVAKLMNEGYAIFHIPNLHAKIVLSENFASIGSQNLTRGGTKNREATYVTIDKKDISEIKAGLKNWLAERQRITDDHIEQYNKLIPGLKRKHSLLRQELAQAELDANDKIEDLFRQRELARKIAEFRKGGEKRRLFRKRIRERTQNIRTIIQSSPKSNEVIAVGLKYIIPSTNSPSYWTLRTKDRNFDNLLKWNIGDEEITLKSRERYLMVHAPTGKLSWPAMNRTQISQFGHGLELSNGILDIPDLTEQSAIDFVWDNDKIEHSNIIINAKIPYLGLHLQFNAYFEIGSVKIVRAINDLSTQSWESRSFSKDVAELIEKPAILEDRVRWQLSNFRKYRKNSIGAWPTEFLGGTEKKSFWIALRKFEYMNRPTLIISEDYDDLL